MKLWRIVSLTLIALGALYIVSDLMHDFFGIEWFILKIPACATMVYGCIILTWGLICWLWFRGR